MCDNGKGSRSIYVSRNSITSYCCWIRIQRGQHCNFSTVSLKIKCIAVVPSSPARIAQRQMQTTIFSRYLMFVAATCHRESRLQLTRLAISLALITSRVALNSSFSRVPSHASRGAMIDTTVLPVIFFFSPFRNTQIWKRSGNPL